MNFHDAPLNTVLNYLSAKMGFVIVADADLHGNATIVSEQPVGTNEVIDLLSDALGKNNYSVSRNGRILTIMTSDNAKTGRPLLSIRPNGRPTCRSTTRLRRNSARPYAEPDAIDQGPRPIDSPEATVTANEAGNAIIMTARQKDIHRFSEIIAALDSSERVRCRGLHAQIRRRQIGRRRIEGSFPKPGFDRRPCRRAHEVSRAGGGLAADSMPLAAAVAAAATTIQRRSKNAPTRPSLSPTTR